MSDDTALTLCRKLALILINTVIITVMMITTLTTRDAARNPIEAKCNIEIDVFSIIIIIRGPGIQHQNADCVTSISSSTSTGYSLYCKCA